MKIVVIEDNYEFNQIICKYINQILIENDLDYDVISFKGYNKKLKRIIHDKEIKIYIVDIKLDNYSGYDICREIREEAYDWDSIIVIASIYNQKENFISLRLLIFTYLSKLSNFENNLKDTIIDASNILEHRNFLAINKRSKILTNDICYILKEKNSKYCFIKTLDNDYRIRRSLKSLKDELKLRKIKNYLLVNDKNIKSTNKSEIIFENNIAIKID